MKRNGLGKLYDKLTAAERFRLDVLATARGDTRESEHLVATCPRFNYTMNDIGFAGRWQAAKELATITYMSLSCTVEKLRLIEGFGHIVSALAGLANLEAEARADATGEEVDEEDRANAFGRILHLSREMPERTEEVKRTTAAGGLSLWRAFQDFCCEEMGVEAERLLETFTEPMLERVRELEEVAESLGVEPYPEAMAQCRAAMRENWHHQLTKG